MGSSERFKSSIDGLGSKHWVGINFKWLRLTRCPSSWTSCRLSEPCRRLVYLIVVCLLGVHQQLSPPLLQVVLTLGTVLCCIFIAARVLWASRLRTASTEYEGLRERSPPEKEEDWMGFRGRKERRAPSKRNSMDRESRTVVGWGLDQVWGLQTEGSKIRSKGTRHKEPALWTSMRGGFDEVLDRAKTFVTSIKGSTAGGDLLSMFDVSADSASRGASTYQRS